MGHDASFFDQTPYIGGWSSGAGRLQKVARAVTRPAARGALNLALLSTVFARRPDLVVVMKGHFVLPETIEAMRKAARAVVSVHTDDLENPGNTNHWMLQAIPLWDVMFSTRSFVGAELKARGARRYELLPFAYDPVLSHPPTPGEQAEPGIEKAVTFVGSNAPERPPFFEPCVDRFPLMIWGGGWGSLPKSSPLQKVIRKRQVVDGELRAILSRSAISVALLRKANRDLHTMRTFEIPACGGFMLAERTDEHQAFFEEGREAEFFSSSDEFAAKAERYLKDAPARRAIAAAGYRRVTSSGYAYSDRAARIVEVVSELG